MKAMSIEIGSNKLLIKILIKIIRMILTGLRVEKIPG